MKIDKTNLSIQIFAFIGFILTIELAFIYYNANYEQYSLSSFCSVNDFIDCDGIAKSDTSQFLGIPLAYWGMMLYLVVMFLSVVDKLAQCKFLKFLEVFKNPKSYITVFSVTAFVISLILAGISIFQLKKICVLCFVTYFIDLAISLVSSNANIHNMLRDFKNTFFDFIDGFKKYPKTAITGIILLAVFLGYSGITLNFVPKVKRAHAIKKFSKIKHNPYRISGNILGNEKGNVKIELYSDFVCPLCYINNIMLHKVVKSYKNVYVIHHNYPFDKECNPNIMINMHPKACFMWKGAIAARNQGNYWGMGTLLYEKQPQNKEDMLKLAKQLNFDIVKFEKDMNSNLTKQEITKEVSDGWKLDIEATPTMYINGHKIVGVKPYYELEKILIENGAKK